MRLEILAGPRFAGSSGTRHSCEHATLLNTHRAGPDRLGAAGPRPEVGDALRRQPELVGHLRSDGRIVASEIETRNVRGERRHGDIYFAPEPRKACPPPHSYPRKPACSLARANLLDWL